MAGYSEKPIGIQELELRLGDKAFFHLFHNLSIFTVSPSLKRQETMIKSLADPHLWLSYAENSKPFYRACKSESLREHWQKLLDQQNENRSEKASSYSHPFDALLETHCRDKIQLAQSENNLPLAKAFEKMAEKYSKFDIETSSEKSSPRSALS